MAERDLMILPRRVSKVSKLPNVTSREILACCPISVDVPLEKSYWGLMLILEVVLFSAGNPQYLSTLSALAIRVFTSWRASKDVLPFPLAVMLKVAISGSTLMAPAPSTLSVSFSQHLWSQWVVIRRTEKRTKERLFIKFYTGIYRHFFKAIQKMISFIFIAYTLQLIFI